MHFHLIVQLFALHACLLVVLGCKESTEEAKTAATSVDVDSIIASAMRAHGGADRLLAVNVARVTFEIDGEFHQPGMQGQFVVEDIYNLPHQYKRVVSGTADGKPFRMVCLFDGDKAWTQFDGGEPIPMPPVSDQSSNFLFENLIRLHELTLSDLKRSACEPARIEGRDAHCVRAEGDRQWCNWYFDKSTNFLVAVKKIIDDPEQRQGQYLTTYSEFKNFEGLMLPTVSKVMIDGAPYFNVKVKQVELPKEIDPSVFVLDSRPRRSL